LEFMLNSKIASNTNCGGNNLSLVRLTARGARTQHTRRCRSPRRQLEHHGVACTSPLIVSSTHHLLPLRLQCKTAASALSKGGYYTVLTTYYASCRVKNAAGVETTKAPCPPEVLCAGVPTVTDSSICNVNGNAKIVA
jgi:hypothetical protein